MYSLKEKLQEIKLNDYAVPQDISAFDLALTMIENIGSIDPELRDHLIYSILFTWMTRKVFTKEQLSHLLTLAIDENHLFYKIGEQETDSVFTRAFSILVVAVAIYVHREYSFISDEYLKIVKEKVIQYTLKEKDLRGYVEIKGWAHSAAHTADALDELSLCNTMNSSDLLEILQSIKTKVSVNSYTYINEEDERLTTAIVNIMSRNLIAQPAFIDWIRDFRNLKKIGKYPEDHRILLNTKNFLRSLYFRILGEERYKTFLDAAQQTLKEISRF